MRWIIGGLCATILLALLSAGSAGATQDVCLGLSLDTSGSFARWFPRARQAAGELVGALRPGDCAVVAAFGPIAVKLWGGRIASDADLAAATSVLTAQTVSAEKGSDPAAALGLVLKETAPFMKGRSGSRWLVLVLSDGFADAPDERPMAAERLRIEGLSRDVQIVLAFWENNRDMGVLGQLIRVNDLRYRLVSAADSSAYLKELGSSLAGRTAAPSGWPAVPGPLWAWGLGIVAVAVIAWVLLQRGDDADDPLEAPGPAVDRGRELSIAVGGVVHRRRVHPGALVTVGTVPGVEVRLPGSGVAVDLDVLVREDGMQITSRGDFPLLVNGRPYRGEVVRSGVLVRFSDRLEGRIALDTPAPSPRQADFRRVLRQPGPEEGRADG